MPLSDNLLPQQGKTPWYTDINTAWNTLRSFVNGLETSIAGKANTTHTHTTAQVTGLDTALAGKAASTHTHTVAQLSDATPLGRDIAKASTAAAARTLLGAGGPIPVYDTVAQLQSAMPAASTPVGTLAVTREG